MGRLCFQSVIVIRVSIPQRCAPSPHLCLCLDVRSSILMLDTKLKPNHTQDRGESHERQRHVKNQTPIFSSVPWAS